VRIGKHGSEHSGDPPKAYLEQLAGTRLAATRQTRLQAFRNAITALTGLSIRQAKAIFIRLLCRVLKNRLVARADEARRVVPGVDVSLATHGGARR
jgi:hypothetical protein